MTLDPATLFMQHSLSFAGLHRVDMGYQNEVWMTESGVLRLGASTDHAHEAAVALEALKAGVRTARPLAWGVGFSIWERLPGRPPTPAQLSETLWTNVLSDLERLHARPPLPFTARPREVWTGDPALVKLTQDQASWTTEEHRQLVALLTEPYPLTAPVFVHGDAYSHNILVDDQGGYVGLIDWGNARWATLEHECACLDDMTVALARWQDSLDLGLVWRVRLNLLLEVAAEAGRVPFSAIRDGLANVQTSALF